MVYQGLTSETKGLLASFVLHSAIIGFYFIFLHSKSLGIIQESKTIVLEMSMLEQKISSLHVPQEVTHKPIEQQKPIIKKETIKPLPQKEVFVPMPVQESIKPISSTENLQPVRQEETASSNTPTTSEPFIKTDFEIIRNKVLSHLVYPSIARRMGWSGVVHVALTIDTQGKLLHVKIHQSSDKKLFDDAAVEAANELKNDVLPKPQSIATVILPISFRLR